ncbi:MAG: hypothetical protein JXL84_00015 [Deltaproteobacteria bacterium]|nr:hypothetical protein [Deltaproteobacteria bacterium]
MILKKLICLPAFLFLGILLLPGRVQAGAYTEVFHSGKVDWWKGTAEAVGVAAPPKRAAKADRQQGKLAAEAEKAARRNLVDLLGKIKVDSGTSVAQLFARSEALKKEVQLLAQKTPVQRIRNRRDGSVEATIRMNLSGPLSDLLLPKDIQRINPVLQPKKPAEKVEKAFTGLIVECSGIRVRPAMVPKIYDEDGQMVFGPPFISREYALMEGVARYVRDFASGKAEANGRVAPRPLKVKGIRTSKTGSSDIVIGNADAARVKASAGNLRVLQRCRLLIVLE